MHRGKLDEGKGEKGGKRGGQRGKGRGMRGVEGKMRGKGGQKRGEGKGERENLRFKIQSNHPIHFSHLEPDYSSPHHVLDPCFLIWKGKGLKG